jgi:2-polyprenyl-3-methyl-5-hydroxy-6-metoxy-1,4-benzoquinol methylase
MAGGLEAAFEAGATELASLALPSLPHHLAIDLGAGFGMHSVPFARKGGRVLAIDSSQELLNSLAQSAVGLPVQRIKGDLLEFQSHVTEAPQVVLCMGDTITHLPNLSSVERLIEMVAREIASNGTFVITFRNYTVPLVAEQRFVRVRSDNTRILTCFLEYEGDVVNVHDVLHQRDGDEWRMTVSSYRKLRIHPEELSNFVQRLGFDVQRQVGMRGMVRLVCRDA